MKKNKFLKMFLTFVCILAISIVSEHVYGYQLKYKAFYNKEQDKKIQTDGYVILRTVSNTDGTPRNNRRMDICT